MRLHPCFITGSILLDCILLGMGSKPAAVRVFCMGSSMALLGSLLVLESAKGAGQETCFCFIWIPKVTESILSDCILRGMGSNPAAVRVFAWASPRHPLLEACWCWRLPRVLLLFECSHGLLHGTPCSKPAGVGGCQGCRVLWFPKVTGHILSDCILPCCCSSLSHGQSIVFYGFQRWRERVFWHGCFGTGPKQCLFFMGSKGDVKEFFGMRFAWRVLASCWCSGVSEPDLLVFGCFGTGPKHCFLWVPKVTWKSFLACVLLGVSC